MDRVSATSNMNCVARAISTMRLALGYKEALPSWFEMGSKDLSPQFLENLEMCFPKHQVTFYTEGDTSWQTEEIDNQLLAFAYVTKCDVGKGHMVIGEPVGLDTLLVVCVSLEKKGGQSKC